MYNINIDMGVSENCGLFLGYNGSHDQQRHIWMCLKLGGKQNFLIGKIHGQTAAIFRPTRIDTFQTVFPSI